jgi:hypothetical protein
MTRPQSIRISVPSLNTALTADLAWEDNSVLCEALVSALPFSTILSHVMASGECMYSPARVVGVFDVPQVLLTTVPRGSILLGTSNYKEFSMIYGKMTEPLPVPVPVAHVRQEDLTEMARVGREVWFSSYCAKNLIQIGIDIVDPAAKE